MTSACAVTEPLAVQVMRAVLSSRLPAAPDQRQAIEDALAVHDSLYVRVSVGHSECEARCIRSAPVELWSVRVEEEGAGGGGEGPQPLPGLFLLNAVRSYVHFSQLSAWLQPGGSQPPPAAASYELLQLQPGICSSSDLLPAPADATVAEHAFPLARDASAGRRVVRVAVRHVQRVQPLQPTGLCLQLGRLPTDEWLLPSPLPSPTGSPGLLTTSHAHFTAAAAEAQMMIIGAKHKAAESSPYSPTEPALKQAHFGVNEEQLVIEQVRVECSKGDTVVEEEEGRCIEMLVEEKKEEVKQIERKEEEGERRVRRRMMTQREGKEGVKKERRGGLRRMIGGWEECVLKGVMEERPLPQAGYTLTIVAPASPPVRLRLTTSALLDTVATCVSRTTVAENERVRESVGQDRKMIRRRGMLVSEAGQLQMSLLNGEGTLLRLLTIPYDAREVPHAATTIIRHRVRLTSKTGEVAGEKTPLRYLVQLSISRDRSGRCFVTGEITVVFTTDASVDGCNVEMDAITGVARAVDLYELKAETVTAPFSLKTNLVVI